MATRTTRSLFDEFLLFGVNDPPEDNEGNQLEEPKPVLRWRYGTQTADANEIAQFCFPYLTHNLFKKRTVRTAVADEFVFVLSKANESEDQHSAMTRTYGFCRRFLPTGPGDRMDLQPRYPQCFCLLSPFPLFTLFPKILKAAQGISLLHPEALESFIQQVRTPEPFPLQGEAFRVSLSAFVDAPENVPKSVTYFHMPSGQDSPMFQDVAMAPLLHTLGHRKFLLLLTALLSEQRVIMVSKDLKKLSRCIHGAIASLQPFQWQHIFIPLLPSKLLHYACAPYPFLIGLHGDFLSELVDPHGELALSQVLIVDLDSATLLTTGDQDRGESSPLRDIVGGGLFSPPRAVRSGVDKIDQFRVKTTRYVASRLEMLTPVELASNFETLKDKNADSAQILAERLRSIGSSTGRHQSGGSSHERGADDYHMQDALTTFYLQLFGDPTGFRASDIDPISNLDAVREHFLQSREKQLDKQPLRDFLAEFVTTQMFEGFSSLRDVRGQIISSQKELANIPFFQCATTISSLHLAFDRKTIRKVVSQVQTSDRGTASVRHHPLALAVTSNSSYSSCASKGGARLPGDLTEALDTLCGEASRDMDSLARVVRTIEHRLSDTAGLNWRHGHKAMALLRSMLLNAHEAILPEALDLLRTIIALKSFKSGLPRGAGSGSGENVRSAAAALVPLIIDVRRLRFERVYHVTAPLEAERLILRACTRTEAMPTTPFSELRETFRPSAAKGVVGVDRHAAKKRRSLHEDLLDLSLLTLADDEGSTWGTPLKPDEDPSSCSWGGANWDQFPELSAPSSPLQASDFDGFSNAEEDGGLPTPTALFDTDQQLSSQAREVSLFPDLDDFTQPSTTSTASTTSTSDGPQPLCQQAPMESFDRFRSSSAHEFDQFSAAIPSPQQQQQQPQQSKLFDVAPSTVATSEFSSGNWDSHWFATAPDASSSSQLPPPPSAPVSNQWSEDLLGLEVAPSPSPLLHGGGASLGHYSANQSMISAMGDLTGLGGMPSASSTGLGMMSVPPSQPRGAPRRKDEDPFAGLGL